MNRIWTVTQAAEELGVTPTWIGVTLKKMGKEKAGGIYLIDEETMEYLRSRKGKRGRPIGAKNREKVEEIDYSDIPKLTKEQMDQMKPLHSIDRNPCKPRKEVVTIRLDADVLQTLRKSGNGWQTRLNDFIRQGVEHGRI